MGDLNQRLRIDKPHLQKLFRYAALRRERPRDVAHEAIDNFLEARLPIEERRAEEDAQLNRKPLTS